MESFPYPFLYTIKASTVSPFLGKTKNTEHHPLTASTLRRPAILNFAECIDTLFPDANDDFTTLLSVFCYKLIYSYRFLKYVKSKREFSSNYSRRSELSVASSKIFSNKKITLMPHVCFEAPKYLFIMILVFLCLQFQQTMSVLQSVYVLLGGKVALLHQ